MTQERKSYVGYILNSPSGKVRCMIGPTTPGNANVLKVNLVLEGKKDAVNIEAASHAEAIKKLQDIFGR